MKLVIISVWFQLLWFLAVLGQQDFQIPLLLLVAISYLWLFQKGKQYVAQALGLACLGIIVDSFNQLLGIFQFQTNLIPLWLLGLWMIFSWYANLIAMKLTQFPFILVVIIGALGGALSYFAGWRLGAVSWPYSPAFTFGVVAIEWALITGLIVKSCCNKWFTNRYVID